MRFLISILLFLFISFNSLAQSMAEILRLLPAEHALDLDLKQRDTLLQNGEYILPGGDSLETIKFELSLDDESGYIRFSLGFTTGQNGFVLIELRRFKRNDGSILIVYSRVGGALRAYDQHDILFFDYKNSKLVLSKKKLLPVNIPIKDFLNKGTPDSIVKKIQSRVTGTYSLDPADLKSFSYNLIPSVSEDLEKYILRYSMIFTWNGKSFTKKLNLEKEE